MLKCCNESYDKAVTFQPVKWDGLLQRMYIAALLVQF